MSGLFSKFLKRNKTPKTVQHNSESAYETFSELSPNSVYHSKKGNAFRKMNLSKGRSKSCPISTRNHYVIDQLLPSFMDEHRSNRKIEALKRKSAYFKFQWEESERERKEERMWRRQLEMEKNRLKDAQFQMVLASVQKLEELARERDLYHKELNRYKRKCELLENRYCSLRGSVHFPHTYHQFPVQPYPANLTVYCSGTTSSLPRNPAWLDEEDEQDEVKVYRDEWRSPTPPSESSLESESSIIFD